MTKNELQQLQRSMGRVEGKVEEGFKGIHKRQDVTNGNIERNSNKIELLEKCIDKSNVGSHESRIKKVEGFINDLKGRIAIISILIGAVTTIVVFITQNVLKNVLRF